MARKSTKTGMYVCNVYIYMLIRLKWQKDTLRPKLPGIHAGRVRGTERPLSAIPGSPV